MTSDRRFSIINFKIYSFVQKEMEQGQPFNFCFIKKIVFNFFSLDDVVTNTPDEISLHIDSTTEKPSKITISPPVNEVIHNEAFNINENPQDDGFLYHDAKSFISARSKSIPIFRTSRSSTIEIIENESFNINENPNDFSDELKIMQVNHRSSSTPVYRTSLKNNQSFNEKSSYFITVSESGDEGMINDGGSSQSISMSRTSIGNETFNPTQHI